MGRDQVTGCLLPVVNLYHFVLFLVALISVAVLFLEPCSKALHIAQLRKKSLSLSHQSFPLPLICALNIPLPLLCSRYYKHPCHQAQCHVPGDSARL